MNTSPVLGFLYPGYSAEDDYPRLGQMVDAEVSVELVHTEMAVDAHRDAALRDIGDDRVLADGAARLTKEGLAAVVWACTSGSFIFGRAGAAAQVSALAGHTSCPTSSTSWAFEHALRHLGIEAVAVAATYPSDVAERFVEFLEGGGVRVLGIGVQDILTAAEVGTLQPERVHEFVGRNDRQDAQAVLVPDTALHTAECVESLEEALGKPVLTANQVTFWEALRLAQLPLTAPRLGQLFR